MSKNLAKQAMQIRKQVFQMVTAARSGHLGASFSCIDILTVLYFHTLNIDPQKPDWSERDRFILSKGHAAGAWYVTLSQRGYFPATWLENYVRDGSPLPGHPAAKGIPGVDFATGSLGHGLSVAAGMALAAKRNKAPYRTFAIISDGECNEGAVWEAALMARQFKLDNLTAIVDYNRIQSYGRVSEVMELEPFADKWRAFGWSVREVDGHNHDDLAAVLDAAPIESEKPNLVIAHTIKGKGVSFMEDTVEWHYLTPTAEQMEQALTEISKTERELKN